jgi:hypothetical protein
MKESFILYVEQKEIIDMLTDEEAGKIFKAIYEYELTGNVTELPYTLKLIFIPIKQSLERNKEKYDNVVERNRLNGKKGGRPKKPSGLNDNPKNPSGYLKNPKKPKKADNDNDNDNDNEPDNVNGNDSEYDSDNVIQLGYQDETTKANMQATLDKVKKLFDKHKEVD